MSLLSVVLLIICVLLFLYGVIITLIFLSIEKAYSKHYNYLNSIIEEYIKSDTEILDSLQELLVIFKDFQNISSIIGGKYDLMRYPDYAAFINKIHQINQIISTVIQGLYETEEKNISGGGDNGRRENP